MKEEVIRITGRGLTQDEADRLYSFAQTFFKHIVGVCVKHG